MSIEWAGCKPLPISSTVARFETSQRLTPVKKVDIT